MAEKYQKAETITTEWLGPCDELEIFTENYQLERYTVLWYEILFHGNISTI